MTIRKDFTSVEEQLARLYEYSKVFHKNNIDKWPHLKNNEDFDRIFKFTIKDKLIFEKVYSVGRDCAVAMSEKLQSFNYADQHLTLTEFIHSFQNGWVYEVNELKEVSELAEKTCITVENCPWSVKEMIILFNEQLNLLSAVAKTLVLLKQSELYKSENDIAPNNKNIEKKRMTMAQKITLVASIATIISAVAIFFPNEASSNQTSNGNQSPNIQTKNGNSTISYGSQTTNNNYYIDSKKNLLYLKSSMLFKNPSVLDNNIKSSLCTVESGSQVTLLGEKKDLRIVGVTWIKVNVVSGTCSGITGWTGKEKLVRK